MTPKSIALESFWTRHCSGLAVAVVVLVATLGHLLDRLLGFGGVTRGYLLLVTNAVTGIVAGGLFFQMAKHAKAQRALLSERMRTVAELNHHIRNALQVIKLCGAQSDSGLDGRALQLIKESADRIEWALREVLPRYPVNEDAAMPQPPVGYAAVSSANLANGPFSERGHLRPH